MTFLWYILWIAATATWALVDSRARHASGRWVAAVALAGPFGLAAYLALRPLRDGESREGGGAWQCLSLTTVTWTAMIAVAVLWNLWLPFTDIATIGVAWVGVAVPALVVGLALKRNTTEHGPTGVIRAMDLWFSGPERTADGRAYICRECGKEYPVELRFCDGCGAWPGQSG